MPNWCSTNVIIRHNDKKSLEGLYNKIKEWTSKDYYENGFGNSWLGNIVGNSGIAEWDEKGNGFYNADGEFISCRGLITSCDCHGEINIWQDDAWSPNLKLWGLVLEKYLPDAKLIYTGEEPGCGLYVTNNPDIEGLYCIDIFDPPENFEYESMYEAEEDDVVEVCQKILGTDETDLEKLLERVKNDIDYLVINQWRHCDVEDCN